MSEDQFLGIIWPEEFVVEYTDGTTEYLFAGEGVSFTRPDDDLKGPGFICAELPKKHVRNSQNARVCYLDEICRIREKTGRLLWKKS